jgi:RNA-directed DNA polymerase
MTSWPDSSIEADAERFLAELRERFAKFGLELHPDKTRIVEFGRYAERNRRKPGDGKPETFNFLGFTHICGKTRKGHFTVLRQTMRQRWQAKLRVLKDELRRACTRPFGNRERTCARSCWVTSAITECP